MKVGILSSYATKCGIASHSQGLVGGLIANGVLPQVFCNHSTGDRAVEPLPDYATPMFWVSQWEGKIGFDPEPILNAELDILHVQYHALFIPGSDLNDLFTKLRANGTKVVVTFHDTAIMPNLDLSLIDLRLSYRPEVPADRQIKFGVTQKSPVVVTFGLGRTRYGDIEMVCKELGFEFRALRAKDEWLPTQGLHDFLRKSDAIVLWYDNVHVTASSQAARTAIATRRPVFLNTTCEWFSDLRKHENNAFYWFESAAGLIVQLQEVLTWNTQDEFIDRFSWKNAAADHILVYRALLA